MNNLTTLTPEERLAAQEKSKASREAKKAYAEQNLKLSYADDSYWNDKSSHFNIRLPQKHDVGVKGIRKVAKKLNVDVKAFLETTGCTNLNELVSLNPTWNSRSLASLVMEYYVEQNQE